MEIKYCERCGIFLGRVAKNRKYCLSCYNQVSLEQGRARWKKKQKLKQEELAKPVPCAWCGKPLVRRNICQKYHPECQRAAYLAVQKELRQKYKETGKAEEYSKKPKKKKPEPLKNREYTIEEIETKAKELGTTYGKVVLGLQTGTITRW